MFDPRDVEFMQRAMLAARMAGQSGEVPIGAVLVCADGVAVVSHNQPIARHDPTAHAEILALREGAARQRNYRLSGSTLYVTVEPCEMCLGAMFHARVGRLIFGCDEPKTGALTRGVSGGTDRSWLEITGGVCADESRALLQEFFRLRRGA